MERLGIETTQNVFIEQDLANAGERVLAQIIDTAILFAYFFILLIIVANIGSDFFWGVFSLLQIPVFFYSLACEILLQGQTIGKMALSVKVVKLDGTQPTYGDYLTRWIFKLVDVWLSYGSVALVTVIASGRGQRLGDIAAGTAVIKLNRRPVFHHPVFCYLPADYKPTYEEVKLLTDKDINLISDVLRYCRISRIGNTPVVLTEIIKAIELKTGIKNTLNPLLFLEYIIRDYNYVHRVKK